MTQGLGMTADEVEKYINQVAFSEPKVLRQIQRFC
jgi:HSP90 family molecular chaperone